MAHAKPHLTYEQQVELLVHRGMLVGDAATASERLSRTGYYRLSGYWYPYRELKPSGAQGRDDNFNFARGTAIEHVLALCEMDRRLTLLVLDFVEQIEIAVRVQVGTRGTRWVATEIMDFGSLSNLCAEAKRPDRDRIAAQFRVIDATGRGNGMALENWLRALTYLRNVCAHHSRPWNRNMTVQAASSHLLEIPLLRHLRAEEGQVNRVCTPLCVLGFLLKVVAPNLQWSAMLRDVLVPGLRSAKRGFDEMGFPPDRREQAMWQPPANCSTPGNA